MHGRYDLVVNSRRLQYKFTIRRNVTIIRGQSATGKTTLVDMIRDCNENGIDSGVTINCARNCVVLSGRNWQREIYGIRTSGKYGELKSSYHEFYRLYENSPWGKSVSIENVITEDSNSGYQFFAEIAQNNGRNSICEEQAESSLFA